MSAAAPNPVFLIAFDFDHTVVDENTDVSVQDLSEIPSSVRAVSRERGWTAFMGAVFEHLHSRGVQRGDIEGRMEEIPFAPGMRECLESLQGLGGEVIIISDSNSFFIEHILDKKGMQNVFRRVFTNPARFDESGLLRIEPYHSNKRCKLSGPNLCKGRVLHEYIKERSAEGVKFSFLAYVGDGGNDFCPMMTLSEGDLAFTRDGEQYAISRVIERRALEGLELKAERVGWSGGGAILDRIKEKVVEEEKSKQQQQQQQQQ